MIERLNERIMIQRNTVSMDQYANRVAAWSDYYSCACYADTFVKEESGEVVPTEERTIVFEVRFCSELQGITSTEYRVLFHGEAYGIVSADMMNWQRKTIRLHCRKEKRA